MVSRWSSSMLALMTAAQSTGFAMPRCRACAHRFYPPQSFCPACLVPDVEATPSSGDATVLSTTLVRRSLDPAAAGQPPLHVARVVTVEGPSLFVMADRAFEAGSRVRIRLHNGLFHASEVAS